MDTLEARLARLQRMGQYLGARRTEVLLPRREVIKFTDLTEQSIYNLAFDAETGRCILTVGVESDPVQVQKDLLPVDFLDMVEAVMFPLVRKKLDDEAGELAAKRERERLLREFDERCPG
jgi:hypothetical protein